GRATAGQEWPGGPSPARAAGRSSSTVGAPGAGGRGESLTPLGRAQTGTVAETDRSARSTADRLLSPLLVTQAKVPAGSTTTPCGPAPVSTVARTVIRAVSISDTAFPGASAVP